MKVIPRIHQYLQLVRRQAWTLPGCRSISRSTFGIAL